MMQSGHCEALIGSLGELYCSSSQGNYDRIRTPFLYPDGDVINLFCKMDGDTVTVTDLGESTRWLRMQTAASRRSSRQQALIQDICLNHNVEFYKGMLVARCRPGDEFPAVVTRVAQAALRVADIWFTFRTRTVQSLGDEVSDFLTDRLYTFERGETLIGRSGRVWNVDFHVRTPGASSLVSVLATGSRSAARGVTEHVLASWYDLSQLQVGPEAIKFLSLFDDTVDVWSREDFNLLEPLSSIARWSQPETLLEQLGNAA